MKFVVLKIADVDKYCSFEQQEQLSEIRNQIQGKRTEEGKTPENRYYVVNVDEPYSDEIKHLIEESEGEEVTFN